MTPSQAAVQALLKPETTRVGPLVSRWSAPVNRWGSMTTPCTGPRDLVVLSQDSDGVKAVNATTGEEEWTRSGLTAWSPPAVDGDKLFLRDYSHVRRLDPETGQDVWSFTTEDRGGGRPAVGADGHVYQADCSGRLYALDSADGSLLWQYPKAHSVVGVTPQGTVLARAEGELSSDGRLVALDGKTGEELWSTRLDNDSQVVLDGAGTVIFQRTYFNPFFENLELMTGLQLSALRREAVYAFAGDTGKKLWRRMSPDGHRLSAGQGELYLQDGDGVESVDSASGRRRWFRELGFEMAWATLGGTPTGLLVADRGHLAMLEPDTGGVRWKGTLEREVTSQPQVDEAGRIFLRSEGDVLCFDRPENIPREPGSVPVVEEFEDYLFLNDVGIARESS